MQGLEHINRDRFASAVVVALLHALLAYAFIVGLGVDVAAKLSRELKTFDVREQPPAPPPEPIPAPARNDKPEGAASPVSLESRPSPVVAPPPAIRLNAPTPIVTTPKATPVPEGNDRTAGMADTEGPGTGAGGQGIGLGSGGRGDGGGGGAVGAQRVSGAISGVRDYPRSARRAGIEGSVSVRFTIETDGRTSGCRVTRSSGNADLDETTCRLIELRFLYRPARDSQGRPVPEMATRTFDWLLPFRS
jgi:protein TonB